MDDFIKFRNNAHSRWSYRHYGRVKSAIKYRVNKFNIPLEYFNGIKYMNELNDKTIQYIKDTKSFNSLDYFLIQLLVLDVFVVAHDCSYLCF